MAFGAIAEAKARLPKPSITILSSSESVAQQNVAPTRVCSVCQREYSKYTCPRCNIAYCSLNCYKVQHKSMQKDYYHLIIILFQAHSEGCTEEFYHEHVSEELRCVMHGLLCTVLLMC